MHLYVVNFYCFEMLWKINLKNENQTNLIICHFFCQIISLTFFPKKLLKSKKVEVRAQLTPCRWLSIENVDTFLEISDSDSDFQFSKSLLIQNQLNNSIIHTIMFTIVLPGQRPSVFQPKALDLIRGGITLHY